MSLSSPGHAVSPFRGEPFWERFRVRSRGFARRDAQTQRKVPTVHFEGNWRCKLSPKAAKSSFFIGSGRNVWEVQIEPQSCIILFFYRFWTQRLTLKIIPTQVEKRCPWARQAMLFPCSGGSLFGKAFGSEVAVLPVVIPKRNRRCKRRISKPNRGAQWAPKLQNLLFFIGFRRNVWQWRSPQRLPLPAPDLSPCWALWETKFSPALPETAAPQKGSAASGR